MGLFSRTEKDAERQRAAENEAAFHRLGAIALEGVAPIGDARWRERIKVAGRVKAMRVQPWADQVASLELTLADGTGGITVVFLGRRKLGGIDLGTHLVAEGTTSEHHGLLTMLNPSYQLLPQQVPLPH